MHAHRGSDKDAQVSHGHSHGAVDGEILASGRGIRATKISLAVLLVTAVVQLVIVGFTGSVALLADTIHNFGDAATALPLWAAFTLSRKLPTKRFNYGYGRAEDLAGLLIFCPSGPPSSSPPTSPSTGWATRRRSITYGSWPWPPSSGSRAMKVWPSTE